MTNASRSPSILFVHGAAHGGWCWEEHFTDWFQARGYTVAAPDLPHQGKLRRRGIRFASLKKYVNVVDEVAVGLGRPLIVVGHSMGGFVAQKYLESAPADLGVLSASLPPTGGSSFGRRLMRRYPRSFLKTLFTLRAADSIGMTREMLFTADTPEQIVRDCHHGLAKESLRILMDMNTPIRTEQIKTPVVAAGADGDEMFATREEVAATAKAFGTEPIQVPGGHDMMLDTHWEQAARAIETAIAEHVSARRVAS